MYLGNIIPLNKEKILVSMIVNQKKIIFALVIAVLAASTGYFGVKYFSAEQELKKNRKELSIRRTNAKIVSFSNLFIGKVLKAKGEVSFEDRLKLENAVRDLNDKEILSLWDKFTSSSTQDEAQEAVKNLLAALVKKISY